MAENFLVGLDLNQIGTEKKAYQYELDDAFWSQLDQEEILGGKVNVRIEAREMAGDIFSISISVSGAVKVVCDRCLEQVEIPVEAADTVKATYHDCAEGVDEDILLSERGSGKTDLSWLIYEIVETSLPTVRKHEKGFCNDEMAKRIG